MYSFPLREQAWHLLINFLFFHHFNTISSVHSRKTGSSFAPWDWSSMLIDPLGSHKAKWVRTAPHIGRLPTIQRAPQLVHPHSNSSYSLPAVCVSCHCLLRVLNALCYEIVSIACEVPFIIPIPWRISGLRG